jgi:hypothetical protein
MPPENEAAQQNLQPTEQPSRRQDSMDRSTFKERAAERLRTEGGNPPRHEVEEKVIDPNAVVKNDAHQSENVSLPELEKELQPNQNDVIEEVDNSYVEDMGGEQDITTLRQRAEDADARVTSMQSDYTRKTQKLGEARRELLDNLEKSKQVAKVYADRASNNLGRYDNVNWQQLQTTLDPQVYAKRVKEYRRAVQMRDRAVAEHGQVAEFADKQIESQKQYQAEISRDVLSSTLPGWGNELYGSLKDHAVNSLDFTQEEFDNITDHRWIRLIHNDMKMSKTSKHIEGIQQSNSPQSPRGQNKGRPRGADGRYKNAQQNHLANPGDRNATRAAFRERLSAEGRGG